MALQSAPPTRNRRGLGAPGSMPGSRAWNPYAYSMPALLLMGLMVVYPLIYGVYIGFTNWSLQTFSNYGWVGLRNFIAILTEAEFYQVLGRSLIWTVGNVFFHVVIGMWLAILLNRKLPGRGLIRLLLILPWAIPQYIAALSWKTMFQGEYGFINLMLQRLGIASVPWLQNSSLAMLAVIVVNIWLGFPFMMMVCLGGLQAIPGELYEAADVDGATGWQKFRRITLPLLRPVLVPAVTLGSVWTFNNLNVIYLVTGGGPGNKTDILVSFVYKAAFQQARYGFAAAYSLIIFFLLLVWAIAFVFRTQATEEVA